MSVNEKTQTQMEFEKFTLVTKRILKENLSSNENRLREYRKQIIDASNCFIEFVIKNYDRVSRAGQATLDNKLEEVRSKLTRCLDKLGCTYGLPGDLKEKIREEAVSDISKGRENRGDSETSTSSGISTAANPSTPTELEQTAAREAEAKRLVVEAEVERNRRLAEIEADRLRLEREVEEREAERLRLEREAEETRRQEQEIERQRRENENTMAEALKAQKELLDIVNGQIRKPYDGDPMGLQTFLTAIDIAKDFATTDQLKGKLVIYIKGKLDGRAREIITDDVETVEDLVRTLKEKIKPETSKIIEARIATLRYTYGKQEEFATRTEELADALRRTLIIEGMTPEKANEITVDRTI